MFGGEGWVVGVIFEVFYYIGYSLSVDGSSLVRFE